MILLFLDNPQLITKALACILELGYEKRNYFLCTGTVFQSGTKQLITHPYVTPPFSNTYASCFTKLNFRKNSPYPFAQMYLRIPAATARYTTQQCFYVLNINSTCLLRFAIPCSV